MTWKQLSLGEICDAGGGEVKTGPFGSQLHESDYCGDGTPVVMPKDILDGKVSERSIARVADEHVERLVHHKLRAGDIVFGRRGDIGRQALVTEREEGWLCGTGCLRITLGQAEVDPRYLHYYLRDTDVIEGIAQQAIGATMPNLNTSILRRIAIRFPAKRAQRRIASILSAYDDLIENNARRIAILEEIARRIYEEWFVRFRFPGHEKVRMLESELGSVPEGWQLTSLGRVAENHDRYRKPLSKMQRQDFKGPYPYYGAAKVFDYVREYLFDGQFLLLAEDGSVETPDGFPVLQLTDGKFWANNHTHILRGTALASTEYLYLRLEKQPIRGYITGAAQPKLTQANINRIPVLLPPATLMAKFTGLISPFFGLRASLVRKNSNLRTTRDLLLPKLISGELDVSTLPEVEAAAA